MKGIRTGPVDTVTIMNRRKRWRGERFRVQWVSYVPGKHTDGFTEVTSKDI